jgi:hypothetical protein
MRETIGFAQKVGLMRPGRTRAFELRPLNPWQRKASANAPTTGVETSKAMSPSGPDLG